MMKKYSISSLLIFMLFLGSCEDDPSSNTGTISISFTSPIDLRMSNCFISSVWEMVDPPEVPPFIVESNAWPLNRDGFHPTEIENAPPGRYTIKWNNCNTDNYYSSIATETKNLNAGETLRFTSTYLKGVSFFTYKNPEEWQNGNTYELVWDPGELGNIDLTVKVGHWANASEYVTIISKDVKNTGACSVKVPNDILEGSYDIFLKSDIYDFDAHQEVKIVGGSAHIDERDFIYDDSSFETNTGKTLWTNNGDILAMKITIPSDWIRLSFGVIKVNVADYPSEFEIVVLNNVDYSSENIIQSRMQSSSSSTGWRNAFAYGDSYLASDFNNGYLLVGIRFLNDISEPYIGVDNSSTASNNYYFYDKSKNNWSQIRDGNMGIRVHLVRDK